MWQGGYFNNDVGTHLSYSTIYTALKDLWQSTVAPTRARSRPTRRRSSPRVSTSRTCRNDVINQGAGTNYELFIQQGSVGDVTVGAAVSQFQNPLTRSPAEDGRAPLVHPGQRDAPALPAPADVDQCGERLGDVRPFRTT